MQVYINDKIIKCPLGATLGEVLEANKIDTQNVAIAVDYVIAPKAEWNSFFLHEGSKIVIIKAVQGG